MLNHINYPAGIRIGLGLECIWHLGYVLTLMFAEITSVRWLGLRLGPHLRLPSMRTIVHSVCCCQVFIKLLRYKSDTLCDIFTSFWFRVSSVNNMRVSSFVSHKFRLEIPISRHPLTSGIMRGFSLEERRDESKALNLIIMYEAWHKFLTWLHFADFDRQQYECRCENGWSGSNCDILADRCSGYMCENGGSCYVNSEGHPFCVCAPTYIGPR